MATATRKDLAAVNAQFKPASAQLQQFQQLYPSLGGDLGVENTAVQQQGMVGGGASYGIEAATDRAHQWSLNSLTPTQPHTVSRAYPGWGPNNRYYEQPVFGNPHAIHGQGPHPEADAYLRAQLLAQSQAAPPAPPASGGITDFLSAGAGPAPPPPRRPFTGPGTAHDPRYPPGSPQNPYPGQTFGGGNPGQPRYPHTTPIWNGGGRDPFW